MPGKTYSEWGDRSPGPDKRVSRPAPPEAWRDPRAYRGQITPEFDSLAFLPTRDN
jgi:hypothetical protein